MKIKRLLTSKGKCADYSGRTLEFKGRTIVAPEGWSDTAIRVVADKYMTPDETSIFETILRIVKTIGNEGEARGYFSSRESKCAFEDELYAIMVEQRASFNSPVWFNVGVEKAPQSSACFILDIDDDMESILNFQRVESRIFKKGSGSGYNVSRLRGEDERLSGGGVSSGPMAFIKGQDAYAGVIKSGGKLRRAAKIVIMDADHPDIMKFIDAKAHEEEKARCLVDAGYSGGIEGEAYRSVAYQNSNFSVRVTDKFMRAATHKETWLLRPRIRLDTLPIEVSAEHMLDEIAKAAWACGDPGIQFHDIVNRWHTCAASGPIEASNPCGEFVFLNNSACNLASININNVLRLEPGSRRVKGHVAGLFDHIIRILIIAQDILVGLSSYPTAAITANSVRYRPLGLGITNLAAWLMSNNIPYDSAGAWDLAGNICARLTAVAYKTSFELAKKLGSLIPDKNAESMRRVLAEHAAMAQTRKIAPDTVEIFQLLAGKTTEGTMPRNAQVTLLAPTGTISLQMDCETTGCEPLFAPVATKSLIGGGTIEQYAKCYEKACKEAPSTISPVLATAIGGNAISPTGHLRMMAAVQPFISGAISKTVNMPFEITPSDIKEIYIKAWKMGLKSITVYRDGSKAYQPLTKKEKEMPKEQQELIKMFRKGPTSKIKLGAEDAEKLVEMLENPPPPNGKLKELLGPNRRKLPGLRKSITHKFKIGGHEGYIIAGMYKDGSLGEVFVIMSKEGSTMGGMMNAFSIVTSMALQYGVPLTELATKMSRMRFEPAGFTGDKDIPVATSIVDYIFRWLLLQFGEKEDDDARKQVSDVSVLDRDPDSLSSNTNDLSAPAIQRVADAPFCPDCGAQMILQGSCHLCPDCGTTGGCS